MRLNRMSRAVRLCIRADAGASSLGLGFLQVRAEANVAHVYVYGTIGGSPWSDSVSVSELVEQIGQITAGTIHVHLNSVGGVVADGFAIYNALRGHGARKIVSVEGQAASIASLVLQAGDERRVYASSLVMVHAPHTFAGGNASDFRQFADTLDVHANAMLEAYARRADDRDEMERLLTDGVDHWYTGSKAVEAGLADVVADGETSARTALVPAAVVAISGYLQALTDQVPPVASQLRGHIARSLTPQVFASLPEVSQQAVIGHIEDTTMKQQYQTILAQAGSPSGATAVAPTTASAPATVQAAADPVQAAIASLQARNADISAAAQPHMGNAAVSEYVAGVLAAADPNVTADHVNRHILSLLGARGEPLNGRAGIPAGGDQRDLTRAAMANAIEARAGITAPTDGNQFRGMTLMEIARACVQGAGVETRGMDRMEIVGQAFTHSSSDFPMLLGDAARRALLQGYQEVEEAFGDFTRAVNVPDFKPTNLVGLGAFSNLDIVPEGGEYKQGTFGEQSQAMQIVTYGKLFTITRQAVINDDLGVFGDVPRKMGQAAKRTLAQAVFDLLLKNPVLADGKALFHADHGNLLPAALISTASVDAMQAAMALQKSPSGQVIQVPMKGLLTPITLRGAARTVRTAEYAVGGAPGSNEPNIVRDTFEVWGDGRLDQKDKKAWYGIANSAYVDGIVVGYLDGNETPYLEQHQGFTVDGVAWKVRLDAAPAIADYRGLYKNPGQAPNP